MKVSNVNKAVEALRAKGIEVRFSHWRMVSWASEGQLLHLARYYRSGTNGYGYVSPVGGRTDCELILPDGRIVQAAICFERLVKPATNCFPALPRQTRDLFVPFCYALGRAVTLGRAIAHMHLHEKGSNMDS